MKLKCVLSLSVSSALLALVLCAGCASRRSAEEPRVARVKWHAHCDACKSCKGSYRSSQQAQEVVTNHNKEMHDWYRVAYYHQGKCPPPQ